MDDVFTVEGRASAAYGEALPLEGARATFDGAAVCVVVAFEDPMPAEVAAVERGPIEAAVLGESGAVVVLLRIGGLWSPGLVEVAAPVRVRARSAHDERARGRPEGTAPSLRIALCDPDRDLVCAVRDGPLPAPLVEALLRGARRQRTAFPSDAHALWAALRVVSAATVPDLFGRAEARSVIGTAGRTTGTPSQMAG